jgi:hypothetical protein
MIRKLLFRKPIFLKFYTPSCATNSLAEEGAHYNRTNEVRGNKSLSQSGASQRQGGNPWERQTLRNDFFRAKKIVTVIPIKKRL